MDIGTGYNTLSFLGPLYDSLTSTTASTTNANSLTALNQAGTSSSASGFGPSALNSIGAIQPVNLFGGYSQLAGTSAGSQASLGRQVSPEKEKRDSATVSEANRLRLGGSFDEAAKLLNGVLEDNPTNARAVHGLGAIELDRGDYEKAEQFFRKASFLGPEYGFDSDVKNARILRTGDDTDVIEQARVLTRSSDTADAGVRLLLSLTKRSPSNAEARVLLAESLIAQGDASNGLLHFQAAISTADPSQIRFVRDRLSELVEASPRAAYLQNLFGQAQLRLGQHEAAAETLALASQLGDYEDLYLADEALAHVALGRDALERGNVTSAMGEFAFAKELDPMGDEVRIAYAEGLTARGESRLRTGDPSRAIDDLKQAASELGTIESDELRERIASKLYKAGRALEARRIDAGEKVDEELEAFQAAYDLDPENNTYRDKLAETHKTIGDEYYAEGELKDAAYAYLAAYEVKPSDDDYKQVAMDTFVEWGDEASDKHDHAGAIAAYRDAYNLDIYNDGNKTKLAEAYNTRGLFYQSLGNQFYSDAADDYWEALRLYPSNQTYQDNYDSVTYG